MAKTLKGQNQQANLEQSSGLGVLLEQVPALNALLNEAVANNWSAAKFQNAVEDSHWWQVHSATARSVIIERANDPETYQQDLDNTRSSIQALSHQLGMNLTEQQLQAISTHAMLTGNTSNQQWLTTEISRREDYSGVKNLGSLAGSMASTATQLQQLARSYGMHWTPAQIAERAQNVVSGRTTLDTYQSDVVQWAQSAFPGLKEQLQAGQTLAQLADPYVQSMSQILEINPGSLDVYTPKIRQALQGIPDKTGQRVPMSLVDFEKQVRQDPRWQYTQNAKDTMSSLLLKVGADWGFGPEG